MSDTNLTRPPQRGHSTDELHKVYVEITTDCNLDCGMCVRDTWPDPSQRMTRETFDALLGHLRAIESVSTVSFSGFGEPTVHPLLPEFLAEVKGAGLYAELLTNGVSLTGELARKLLDVGLDRLTVSLDGVGRVEDPALHGDYAVVRGNLEAFHALRSAGRVDLPEVWIQFVATRHNVHQLPALRSLAPMLGVSGILVTHMVPYAPEMIDAVLYGFATARRSFGRSRWDPVVNLPRFDPRSELGVVAGRLQLRGSHLQVCGADLAGAGMHCRFVAEGCAAITPEGHLSPCLPLMHAHHYWFHGDRRELRPCHLGNVNQAAVAAIWQSEEYRRFRQRVREFRFSPCLDCNGCDLRRTNLADCTGEEFPRCGACLWAAGLIQCP